jgi:hypothetical protein
VHALRSKSEEPFQKKHSISSYLRPICATCGQGGAAPWGLTSRFCTPPLFLMPERGTVEAAFSQLAGLEREFSALESFTADSLVSISV